MIDVAPSLTHLRRDVLAVSVLRDLDLSPADDGLVLDGVPAVAVGWDECERALDGARVGSETGRRRLAGWLTGRRRLADLVPTAEGSAVPVDPAESGLADRVRPLGFPVGHPHHPGPGWTITRVLGDAVELGLGVRGLDAARPDDVLPVSRELLRAASLDDTRCWDAATAYLDAMAAVAAQRWRRDPAEPLRPVGDCDVVTLLGSPVLRSALAAPQGGMCPCVVPMRTRGWTELRRVDPAFAVAAVAATADEQRGFDRPLLVTADEVGLAAGGGRPTEIALRDAEVDPHWPARTSYR
ncbi:MAG TPA: hypothetical protein VGD72_05485 [Mycobacteriales bacterium]